LADLGEFPQPVNRAMKRSSCASGSRVDDDSGNLVAMRRTSEVSDVLRLRLDRHQRARDSGIPTLSVLAEDGRVAPAGTRDVHHGLLDAWEAWLRSRACSSVSLALEGEPEQHLRSIGHALLQGCSALRNVAAFVATHTGEALAAVETRLERLGHPERALLLERASTSARCPRAVRLATAWLDAPDAVPSIDDVGDLVTLVQLRAHEGLPGLLIAMAPTDAALRSLQALAEQLPRMPLAIAVDRSTLEHFLAEPGSARTRALLREGLVRIDPIENEPFAARGGIPGPNDTAFDDAGCVPPPRDAPPTRDCHHGPLEGEPRGTVTSTSLDGLRREVVDLCRGAATNPELADRARSLAERLLFRALEAHPTTRGRFELNATMPFRFGPRAIEIDLLSRRDRVAIEVDGYHHFVDADAYRRDRRKDVLMQRHGLLVLRFLAQDVGTVLESIVDTVVDIVRRLSSSEASV
jgi:very-short-patch-repair endonuclease